jgi:hypothetical protein
MKKKKSSQKSSSRHNVSKWPPSATTPWTLTLGENEEGIELSFFEVSNSLCFV